MFAQIQSYKILIIIPLIIVVFIAFYNGLVVKKYTVKTEKLFNNQAIRIVVISDLHSHIYGKDQSKIADKIRNENPDIIALAGDIIDDVLPVKGAKLFFEAIKDIAPIYYVTGNHEAWLDDLDSIKKLIRSYGINLLENDYKEVNINGVNLIIAGVEDPETIKHTRAESNWYKEIEYAFSSIDDSNTYKILLSHRPEEVNFYNSLPFDIVLSGHTHGGQVRIPFILNGLLAPHQGFFPKYAGGLYELENYTHVVSRGVSFNPLLPRVFNPPEIVVVDIEGKQ